MIVDTSAIMAILWAEPEEEAFLSVISASENPMISSGSWIELAAVLSRPGDWAERETLHRTIEQLGIEIAPMTAGQARIGHEAYLKYGKGNHKARLNFGDCFAYALAKETGRPLLFKGEDFTHTDITPAL